MEARARRLPLRLILLTRGLMAIAKKMARPMMRMAVAAALMNNNAIKKTTMTSQKRTKVSVPTSILRVMMLPPYLCFIIH